MGREYGLPLYTMSHCISPDTSSNSPVYVLSVTLEEDRGLSANLSRYSLLLIIEKSAAVSNSIIHSLPLISISTVYLLQLGLFWSSEFRE